MPADVGGEWNRDAAYHPWILRIAAEHAGDALDVGCGDGLLALRLASVSRSVVGIDRDPIAIAEAHKRLGMVPNTDAAVSEFGTEWGLMPESYDVITMVSVLHELPLVPALGRAAELLKPGGTLLVVGQTAAKSWPDRGVRWLSTLWARACELFYSWRGIYRPEFVSSRPLAPTRSYAEVTDAAAELLPGAELHRGLLGRYRLRWTKPVPVGTPEAGAATSASAASAGRDAELDQASAALPVPAGGNAEPDAEPDEAPVLARDDIEELSRMFEQTREVPRVEPRPDVRRSA
jgi:SAM-dependent methyltransferase